MKIIPLIASGLLAGFTATSALADVTVFEADLLGANELPPVQSPGFGKATVTIDDHDLTMRVQASFSDLLGNVTAAHIHCCTTAPGTGAAGVASPTPSFPGFPSGVTAGSYDQTFDLTQASSWNASFITANGGTTGSAFSALYEALNERRAYFNIHTTSFGGGEIRGTLAPVPEPTTWALLVAGLLPVALKLRRRSA